MPATKRITCLECGHQLTVPAWRYHYPRCPICQRNSFECSATGGCPRCQGGDSPYIDADDAAIAWAGTAPGDKPPMIPRVHD
jgi:hypothetical protein